MWNGKYSNDNVRHHFRSSLFHIGSLQIHHVEVIRISDDGRFHKIDSNNFHEILLYFSSNFNDYSNE